MQRTERSTLVGVFSDRGEADKCVEDLGRAGFRDDQIGFMMQDSDGRGSAPSTATMTEKRDGDEDVSAGAGLATGAITGALVGAAAALFIPAVGPVLAGGILASAFAGAAIGAVTGGVAAGLIDLGVPENEARYYEQEFQSGRILVTVKSDGRYDEARSIMQAHRAQFEEGTARTAMTGETVRGAGETVQLRDEELHASKTPMETGEVRIHKEVTTENRTLDVPVTREEIVIERHAVNRPATSADFKNTDETIRIPVMEEQVTLEKRAVVREEVAIGKQEVTETKHLSGDVRHEEARVERAGDVNVNDGASLSEEERLRRLRTDQQQRRSA